MDDINIKLESYNLYRDIAYTTHDIHLACVFDHSDVLQYLISKGIDVNLFNSEFETPLLIATMQGSYNCIKTLIDNGADASIGNHKGDLPIYFATRKGDVQCLRLIVDAYPQGITKLAHDGHTALFTSYIYFNYDCCRLLLEYGSAIEYDYLDHSIRFRLYNFAKLFIEYGADIKQIIPMREIPDVIMTYIQMRDDCRFAARAILQLRHRKSKVLRAGSVPCGKDVLKLIAKLVWAHRHGDDGLRPINLL